MAFAPHFPPPITINGRLAYPTSQVVYSFFKVVGQAAKDTTVVPPISAPVQIPGLIGFSHGGGLKQTVDRNIGIHSPVHRMPVTPPSPITAPSHGFGWSHPQNLQ